MFQTSSTEAKEIIELKKKKAADISTMRLLTDDDFKEIDAAQIRKQIEAPKKGQKRKLEEEVKPG